jgi:hypothetical protein
MKLFNMSTFDQTPTIIQGIIEITSNGHPAVGLAQKQVKAVTCRMPLVIRHDSVGNRQRDDASGPMNSGRSRMSE